MLCVQMPKVMILSGRMYFEVSMNMIFSRADGKLAICGKINFVSVRGRIFYPLMHAMETQIDSGPKPIKVS